MGCYIASVDAKDLFLHNYSSDTCKGYSVMRSDGGGINTRKFINTLDYSLDTIKLKKVFRDIKGESMTTRMRGKDYCRCVINVTFKYSVKKFNLFGGGVWIRYGFYGIELDDCICVQDGEVVGVRTDMPVKHPVSDDMLPEWFVFDRNDECYKQVGAIPSVHSVASLRKILYEDGFVCDGVKFRRFKRSSGSSRVGKCLFIDEELYSAMHEWELCGLTVEDGQQIDLAALEAYIALTLSSIIGTIRLKPENFLVVDDYKSVFRDTVAATRVDSNNWLSTNIEEVEIENNIWDGQSLIDKSAMGDYSEYGMILLRNRFFKSACFNTNLQTFFADNGITSVSQLNGRTRAKHIKDIKIVTTASSIKYLKFGSLEQWLDAVASDNFFGVVKHEKPTHYFGGRMVQTHYQLLNTLQLSQDEVSQLVQPSLDYMKALQTDPAVMRYHLRFTEETKPMSGASTTKDIVFQMLGLTDKFTSTKLYYEFREDTVGSYKKALRKGHILVDGNYSTLFGNPYEMLLQCIGKFDGISCLGKGEVFTRRFQFNQTILGSRSPHVTMGNVLLIKNRNNANIARYFNLTDEIVCINSIGENILMRLSGADFDSDTMLLTDNPILITAAVRNYDKFCVPTSLVEAKKVVRHYTRAEQADLDIKTSVNKIGEIVNLSQELNTRLWNEVNGGASFEDVQELYCDIAQLDVLSGIEIDKAKKEFVVDSTAEIRKLKKKYSERDNEGRQIKPNFFGAVAKSKGYYDSKRNNYKFHETTMDYLQHAINKYRNPYTMRDTIPFSDLFRDIDYAPDMVNSKQYRRVLQIIRDMRSQINLIMMRSNDYGEKIMLSRAVREEYYQKLANVKINSYTAYKLLLAIEEPENEDISRTLFYTLFSLPNQSFLDFIEAGRTPVYVLREDPTCSGSVIFYGLYFRKELMIPA